ncbi:MAG: tol-pal system protein YbgF [Pseudohongiellaceae bacterium]|jgi:tol-pal system protein YbgF
MQKHIYTIAALLSSAAFLFSIEASSQVEVVDASSEYQPEPKQALSQPQPVVSANSQSQGELFYQLQLLQDEVRMLRGLVEEQAHELGRLKQQSTERYIDVDRRLAGIAQRAPAEGLGTGSATSGSESQVVSSQGDKPVAEGEKAAYDGAYGLVPKRQYAEALSAFQMFLLDFPDGKYAPNAYYWLGELYLVIKPADLEASRQSFTQLIELYPKHPKEADAMYKLGTVYYLKDNKEKSKQWLQRVIAEYGGGVSSAANKAKTFLRDRF